MFGKLEVLFPDRSTVQLKQMASSTEGRAFNSMSNFEAYLRKIAEDMMLIEVGRLDID